MKRIILLIVSLSSFIPLQAKKMDLFKLDEKKIDKEFAALNKIEKQVEERNYNLYSQNFSSLTNFKNYNFSSNSLFLQQDSNTILPPFVWGILTGPVGMIVVYVMSDGDKQKLMRSFWGCLVGGCIWIPVLSLLPNSI